MWADAASSFLTVFLLSSLLPKLLAHPRPSVPGT